MEWSKQQEQLYKEALQRATSIADELKRKIEHQEANQEQLQKQLDQANERIKWYSVELVKVRLQAKGVQV